jgi:hypothetical protein
MKQEGDIEETFYGLLAYDAAEAISKMDANDNQATRREFVRTAFAAVEGWLWDYRQFVQATIEKIRDLSTLEKSALSETSYSISETGKLREQLRFVPMTIMFRFVTRLAEEECGHQIVDFGSVEWQRFLHSLAIRNRITHPKNLKDLTISDADIESVRDSLLWFFELNVLGREKLVSTLEEHLASMRAVGAALAKGNPAMLELYSQVLEKNAI